MSFILAIDTPGGPEHPVVTYDALPEARAAVREAISTGFFRAGNSLVQTGPGTIYKVVSDEQMEAGDPPIEETSWKLIVMISGAELPPFGFETEDALEGALKELRKGWFLHEGRAGHEYTYIQGCTGAVYLKMTTAAYIEYSRQRLEYAQRMKNEEAARSGAVGAPKIVLPGSN